MVYGVNCEEVESFCDKIVNIGVLCVFLLLVRCFDRMLILFEVSLEFFCKLLRFVVRFCFLVGDFRRVNENFGKNLCGIIYF